jgi:HK97 gp10 family phage protein
MATEITYIPNLLIGEEWERALETHVMVGRLGDQVAETARAICPVDTGALRDSIASHAADSSTAEAEIIAEVPYAAFVEFGTSLMEAQPFLRPALDAVVSGE